MKTLCVALMVLMGCGGAISDLQDNVGAAVTGQSPCPLETTTYELCADAGSSLCWVNNETPLVGCFVETGETSPYFATCVAACPLPSDPEAK